jgi:2-polyprenyl-6-methoxyphenol hydroxylase-like FAD-dependent oxidoreductase
MKMKIAVAGTGYVGLSIAVLLSQHHEVTLIGKKPEMMEVINQNGITILDRHGVEKRFLPKARVAGEGEPADLVILFTDPNSPDPWEDAQLLDTLRHCDRQNVPIATNIASAELAIMGLQRGDLDWREMFHTKPKL